MAHQYHELSRSVESQRVRARRDAFAEGTAYRLLTESHVEKGSRE